MGKILRMLILSTGLLGLWSDWAFGKGVYPRIAYSPDGKLLAIADGEGIGLYDVHGVTKVGVLPGYSGAIAFSPDGRVFATGGLNAVHLWDVGQRQPIGVLGWDIQGFNTIRIPSIRQPQFVMNFLKRRMFI